MTSGVKTIIYPVRDLAAATDLFRGLVGADPETDQPYYVGFSVGDQQIGLDPNGHANGLSGPVAYWHVEDIAASLQGLLTAGAQTRQDVKDVGGGRLIAIVADPDGNSIGLIQDT